jgi:hypothetical protein
MRRQRATPALAALLRQLAGMGYRLTPAGALAARADLNTREGKDRD